MDDEVEDIVGDLQYTDSQKSVTTSAVYSLDFTDSSPERQNSSGKETYVIERDDSDDSETTFRFHTSESLNNLNEAMSPKSDMQQLLYSEINKSIRANFKKHTLRTHEFTQTSKTIIELAQNEIIVVHKPTQKKSLETQTSFVSIMEHKTLNYEIHVVDKDGIPRENESQKDKIEEDICDSKKMLISDIRSSHINTNDAINKMFTPATQSSNKEINQMFIPDIGSSHKNTNEDMNKMFIPDTQSSHKNSNKEINKVFIPNTQSFYQNFNKEINNMFIPGTRSSYKNTNEDMNKIFISDTRSSHKNSNKAINKMFIPGIRSFHKNNEDMNKMFIPDTPNSHKNNDEDINNILKPVKQSPLNNTNEQVATEENTLSSVQGPELDNTTGIYSEHSSEDKIIPFIDDESKENEDHKEAYYETTSELESSKYDSDVEEDSLMIESEYRSSVRSKGDNASDTSEMQKSIENDLDELYNKLSESPLLLSPENTLEPGGRKFGTLTPLTEETSQRKSFLDMTTSSQTLMEPTKDTDTTETLFNSNTGVKIKMFSNCEIVRDNEEFKLPPIFNKSCPTNPHLNFLFSVNTNPLEKVGNLPCLSEVHNDEMFESWNDSANHLASGESPLITGKRDPAKTPREPVHLPPIHVEGGIYHNSSKPTSFVAPHQNTQPPEADSISIKGRIKELKMMTNRSMSNNRARSKLESRSVSPASNTSREENKLSDVAERGCENICMELLRKLRSPSWVEVLETLEDIPRSLEKFWPVLTVNRTAELLRQVTVHIDSPRTQVARSACTILAEILKSTNYTRKPDFYEGVSMLLTKTGSFSRPVRRAANMALDDIACGVDVTHAASAICIYGVGHKSALVRCASARLLVVCCALAEGGRQILRARPSSAATARKHVLRALAELLQDKNIDTRKYAERLYTILRPLPSFEAYFLSDVDAEVAARHMKKYDPLLIHKRDSATSLSIFS